MITAFISCNVCCPYVSINILLIHQVDKPYDCRYPGCEKRYTDPSSLRKHVKIYGHSKKAEAEALTHSSSSSGFGSSSHFPTPSASPSTTCHSPNPLMPMFPTPYTSPLTMPALNFALQQYQLQPVNPCNLNDQLQSLREYQSNVLQSNLFMANRNVDFSAMQRNFAPYENDSVPYSDNDSKQDIVSSYNDTSIDTEYFPQNAALDLSTDMSGPLDLSMKSRPR